MTGAPEQAALAKGDAVTGDAVTGSAQPPRAASLLPVLPPALGGSGVALRGGAGIVTLPPLPADLKAPAAPAASRTSAPIAAPAASNAGGAAQPEGRAPTAAPDLAAIPDIRPKARPSGLRFSPETTAAAPEAAAAGLLAHHLRPMARPKELQRQTSRSALPPREASRETSREAQRQAAEQPERIQQAAAIRPAPGTPRLTTPRGSVCGIPGLKGEIISPILGRVQGCGVANPVRITEVDGIRLSQPATIDCETARAFHSWVKAGLRPAMGNSGGGITTIQIAGHYVCRPRNHRKGAKISEHGKGRAVDISGLVLANGQKLSILRDWRGAHGAQLRSAHRAACGIFGTTLGPGSDGMHEDHLHFDTARHRSGTYCR